MRVWLQASAEDKDALNLTSNKELFEGDPELINKYKVFADSNIINDIILIGQWWIASKRSYQDLTQAINFLDKIEEEYTVRGILITRSLCKWIHDGKLPNVFQYKYTQKENVYATELIYKLSVIDDIKLFESFQSKALADKLNKALKVLNRIFFSYSPKGAVI